VATLEHGKSLNQLPLIVKQAGKAAVVFPFKSEKNGEAGTAREIGCAENAKRASPQTEASFQQFIAA
jgi:hypothetical protein